MLPSTAYSLLALIGASSKSLLTCTPGLAQQVSKQGLTSLSTVCPYWGQIGASISASVRLWEGLHNTCKKRGARQARATAALLDKATTDTSAAGS